jgi:hypothetical protein
MMMGDFEMTDQDWKELEKAASLVGIPQRAFESPRD